jgi:hypothetical protein
MPHLRRLRAWRSLWLCSRVVAVRGTSRAPTCRHCSRTWRTRQHWGGTRCCLRSSDRCLAIVSLNRNHVQICRLTSSRIAAFSATQTFLPALRESLQQPVTMRSHAQHQHLREQQPLRSRRQHLQSMRKARRWRSSSEGRRSGAMIAPANSQHELSVCTQGSRMPSGACIDTDRRCWGQPSWGIGEHRHRISSLVFQVRTYEPSRNLPPFSVSFVSRAQAETKRRVDSHPHCGHFQHYVRSMTIT